jgi:L-aspartate semialdehyde sulfurtransferase ferredoxin
MKARYVLSYKGEVVREPLVYTLVKTYDISFNILRAEINAMEEGSMLVELDADQGRIDQALGYLASKGVSVEALTRRLIRDESLCAQCGACEGVCFSGALAMDRTSWELKVDAEACVACALCLKACPFSALSLSFSG